MLKKENIHQPKAIIALPHLANLNQQVQLFGILQAALCFSKNHVSIERIIDHSLLNTLKKNKHRSFIEKKELKKAHNYLTSLQHAKHCPPRTWLSITASSIGILSIILYTISYNLKRRVP